MSIEEAYKACLLRAGLDLDREGLKGTPERLARMIMREICPPGRRRGAEEILSPIFEKESYDELVMLRKIRFSAFCEHHLLPFTGFCAVGYIPAGKLVGISKLARLVEEFSAWPTIQERLTVQVVDAIELILQPHGVMAVFCAEHTCMTARGVRSLDAETITSAVRGVFKSEGDARNEFLRLAGF